MVKADSKGQDSVSSAPPADAVRAAVARILASPSFNNSPRMTAFLRYVVDETLAGRQEYLKEYSIALEVFGRDESFDPQTSPIVRVQASKLRRMLALYYADEGRQDPIRIELRKGSYVPVWTSVEVASSVAGTATAEPVAPPSVEPERRQLTVLMCDLADSAALTERLGAEDTFELMRQYRATATEVVQRFSGHLAPYAGDGLVAYFGYPQAHEDDAERAVRTGLELVERIGALEPGPDIALRVRVGIATGVVVAGDMVGDSAVDKDAVVGDAPNLAARLQTLAEPNQVVIGPRTHRLTGDVFEYADLGAHELKGFTEAVPAWRVRRLNAHDSRFEAAHRSAPTQVHGRDQEIALLLDRWQQAKGAEGQVVLLSGEAGIGKSRIARALAEAIVDEPHFRLRYQCLPYYSNSALYPLINRLERAARFGPKDSPQTRLEKLESLLKIARRPLSEDLPPIAALLSLSTGDRYPPLKGSLEHQRARLLNALLDQLLGLAHIGSVLFVLEDAQWIDPTTLELIEMMIEALQDARVCLLITHRPEFDFRWEGYPHVTRLSLNRLGRNASAAIVADIAGGKTLPTVVENQIVERTDGVPLFVEELTGALLDSDALEEQPDHFRLTKPLPALAIPETLQDSLMSRLDRLAPVKEVAQIAAAIGREFGYGFLRAVSKRPVDTLQDALVELTDAGLILRRRTTPETTYIFKHALVQDTAYQSLLNNKRRQLHARIAEIIQTELPARLDAEPELMAHHATEAGLTETAIAYWEKAGRRAVRRSANAEAANHFSRAIELLNSLPNRAERAELELRLQLALGSVEMSRKGYAALEMEPIYFRARELCRQLGDPPEATWALYGIFMFHFVRCELKEAREVAEKIHQLARESGDSACRVCASVLMGDIDFYSGRNLVASRAHYEESLALYDKQRHGELAELFGDDPAVVAASQLGLVCWLLGFPEQAERKSKDALSAADGVAHVHTLAVARLFSAWLHTWRGEWRKALKQADEAIVLSSEHGFPDLLGYTTGVRGSVLCHLGRTEEGLAQISHGVAIAQGTGAEIALTWFLAALAEGFSIAGAHEKALKAIDDAFALLEQNGERFWEPELHRLKGKVLLAMNSASTDIERCYMTALQAASSIELKSLELRAATCLCRIWQMTGKKKEAYELLSGIYNWFTEGFDTPDLLEAKRLLEELR